MELSYWALFVIFFLVEKTRSTNITVYEGDSVTLPCPEDNSTSFAWFVDSFEFGSNRLVTFDLRTNKYIFLQHLSGRNVTIHHGSGFMTIHEVLSVDENSYVCSGDLATTTTLIVYVRPTEPKIIGLEVAPSADQEVKVTCQVPRIKPARGASIKWQLDDLDLNTAVSVSGNNDSTRMLEVSQVLYFVKTKNILQIKCSVRHFSGYIAVKTVNISVYWTAGSRVVDESFYPQVTVRGQDKFFKCLTTSMNPATILQVQWYINGTLITEAMGNLNGTNSTELIIYNIGERAQGTYTCEITNAAGTGRVLSGVTITVFYPPEVIISVIGDNPADEGSNFVHFQCIAVGGFPRNYQEVKWSRIGQVLLESDVHELDTNLFMRNIERSHIGIYTCSVKNFEHPLGLGWGNSSQVDFVVMYPPVGTAPIATPVNVLTSINASVTLTCNTSHFDPIIFPMVEKVVMWTEWMKDGRVVANVSRSLEYTFSPVDMSENGEYRCRIGNSLGISPFSNASQVNIEAPLEILTAYQGTVSMLSTSFTDDPYEEHRILHCIATGSHIQFVSWEKNGKELSRVSYNQTLEKIQGNFRYGQTEALMSTIIIESVEVTMCANAHSTGSSGLYICRASGIIGGQEEQVYKDIAQVEVWYPPMWNKQPSIRAAATGETIILVCDVCCNPPPVSYTWLKDDHTLRRGIFQNGSALILPSVIEDDFGVYQCEVNNTPITRNVTEDMVSWFNITLALKGPAGKARNIMVLKNITSTSATISWQPGFDGGYPPLSFFVAYQKAFQISNIDNGNFIAYEVTPMAYSWPNNTLTMTVHGLEPSTEYYIQVTARNSRPNSEGSGFSEETRIKVKTSARPYLTTIRVGVQSRAISVRWAVVDLENFPVASNLEIKIKYKLATDPDSKYISYPPKGRIKANLNEATIGGQFDTINAYDIILQVYEEGNPNPGYELQTRFNDSKWKLALPPQEIAIIIAVLFCFILAAAILINGVCCREKQHIRKDTEFNSEAGEGSFD